MKKISLAVLVILFVNVISTSGQVGIGTTNPDKSAVLDVIFSDPANPRGILIPRMSEAERNAIVEPANGLLIYNTDEGCVNYYLVDESDKSGSWNSLCGGLSQSATKAKCGDVGVFGTYMKGAPLNSSNYLSMILDVTKPGAYSVVATTSNGYGFSASGTFFTVGEQLITLTGSGMPTEESSGDRVEFTINGLSSVYSCDPPGIPVTIQVAPANPTFNMNCSSVTVNGSYSMGSRLNPSHTISLTVDVTSLGNSVWTASTNTVDGIYFSGNGNFIASGTQTITLNGYGTPTTAKSKTLTITINSTGAVRTCTATVNCVYTTKRILVMGHSGVGGAVGAGPEYGYQANCAASYNFVKSAVNFGTTATSAVKIQGFSMNGLNNGGTVTLPSTTMGISIPSDASLQSALTGNNPPDIIIIGWGMTYSGQQITTLIDYLYKGGVVIIFNKYSGTTNQARTEQGLFRELFGNQSITAKTVVDINGSVRAQATSWGCCFNLATIPGDPILNGPFGNLNGLVWGGDYFPPTYMQDIPEDQIVTYSGASVRNAQPGGIRTGVTMFRHKTLNLFWVGDGGFLSSLAAGGVYAGVDVCPFATVSTLDYQPATKIFGVASGGGPTDVYNSQLFGNILAWAIQQAENNGINSPGNNTPDEP